MANGAVNYGDSVAQDLSKRVGGNFASTAALTALPPAKRVDGMISVVGTQEWIFIAGSTTASGAACLLPDDVSSNGGRWKTATGGVTGATGATGSTGATGTMVGSGVSGQTIATGITGIRCGTGLSCALVGGHLMIWAP